MSIVLRCRVCKRDGSRSEIDGNWCHLDENIIIQGMSATVSVEGTVDHVFVPDVIDVGAAQPVQTLPDTVHKKAWPFSL